MRIKHYAGYGCVDAKKIYKFTTTDGLTALKVRVSGNHEWGLLRTDDYDLWKWLVCRFDKSVKDIMPYGMSYEYDYSYDYENDAEVCVYTFVY